MKILKYGLSVILLTISTLAAAEPVKKNVIDHQQEQAQEEINAAEKAKPHSEARPAVITSHKKHSVQSPKAEMIKSQKADAYKSAEAAQAAKPDVETRPAVTTKQL